MNPKANYSNQAQYGEATLEPQHTRPWEASAQPPAATMTPPAHVPVEGEAGATTTTAAAATTARTSDDFMVV